jgi:hypothetical protein
VWCLYPNKNAVLESVENVFGQEPDADNEVASEKVCFLLLIYIQIIVVIDRVCSEELGVRMYLEAIYFI